MPERFPTRSQKMTLVSISALLALLLATSPVWMQRTSQASRQDGGTPVADAESIGVGPYGDAAHTGTYSGHIPTGAVGLLWELDVPEGYVPGNPVTEGNHLLINAASEEFGSNLIVHDLHTGAFLWNYATDAALSDPFVYDGMVHLVQDRIVVTLSLETGEEIWATTPRDAEGDGAEVISRPVAAGGRVVVSLGASVVALDATTGSELWRRTFKNSRMRTSVISSDQVLVVSQLGESDTSPDAVRFHAISLTTGHELWRVEATGVSGGGIQVTRDGRVVELNAASEDGFIGLVVDGHTGKQLWDVTPICDPVLASAVVADWFICLDADEPFLDPHTGEPLADAPTWGESGQLRAIAEDHVLVSDGAALYAFDASTGDRTWAIDLPGIVPSDVDYLRTGMMSIGDGALAIEVFVDHPDGEDPAKEILILGGVAPRAATPPVAATPGDVNATPAS